MSQHRALRGLAFDIADLLRIRSWAAHNAVCMDVRLDHGVEGEEYEEVIAFRTDATACSLLMWRDQNTVFAQPMPGRQQCFPSVSAALGRLYVKLSEPVAPSPLVKVAASPNSPETDHVHVRDRSQAGD
jgi:hypothetical protein